MIPTDDSVAFYTDTIRLALAPYCCGPGESFSIEAVQDSHSTVHNDTYLWLDMTWERLRGHYLRDSIKLIYSLCKSVLDRSTLQRIVIMTGQPPSLEAVREASKNQAPVVRLSAPPLITYLAKRAEQMLPLLPSIQEQEDMVPVTRTMKNGSNAVVGWRKPNGPLVVSFDPVVTKDGGYNRKRRLKRRNECQQTIFGSKAKLLRQGRHSTPPRNKAG